MAEKTELQKQENAAPSKAAAIAILLAIIAATALITYAICSGGTKAPEIAAP